MFKSWSLNKKMFLAFTAVAFMLLAVGGLNFYTLMNTQSKFAPIVQMNVPNLTNAAEMRGHAFQIQWLITRIGLEDASASMVDEIKKEIANVEEEYAKVEKAYVAIEFLPGEEKMYNDLTIHWKKSTDLAHKLIDLANSKSPTARTQFFTMFNKEFLVEANAHKQGLSELIQFHKNDTSKNSEAAHDVATIGTTVSISVVVIGFILAMFIGLMFAKILSAQLNEIAQKLNLGAEEVASASKQISEAGTELSASTTEQAAALQETVASVDEISAMISKNADNAKKSQDVSLRSHDTATRGKQAVEDMINSIDEINSSNTEIMSQIEESNREISEIVKVISEIGNKTKIINDIVFQTKLLSFNASVEAARAGEHGKGFAVVAEEVGNLAQMSGNAAKDISQMLEGSIQKVEGIVKDTKTKVERLVVTGKQKVESGTVTAKNCGTILEEIVVNVNEVNNMINEITTASQEQSQGVQEITKAMAQLDQVTQQNATASQQSSQSAEQLTAQAEELHSMVEALMNTVQGEGAHSSKPSHSGHAGKAVAQTIPFKRKKPVQKKLTENVSTAKKVSGSDVLPAENDPRFEDA